MIDKATDKVTDKVKPAAAKASDVEPVVAAAPVDAPTDQLDHGVETKEHKAERLALESDPPSPVPAQMLPENQDETVCPKK